MRVVFLLFFSFHIVLSGHRVISCDRVIVTTFGGTNQNIVHGIKLPIKDKNSVTDNANQAINVKHGDMSPGFGRFLYRRG